MPAIYLWMLTEQRVRLRAGRLRRYCWMKKGSHRKEQYIRAYNAENICIGNEADMETVGIPKWE